MTLAGFRMLQNRAPPAVLTGEMRPHVDVVTARAQRLDRVLATKIIRVRVVRRKKIRERQDIHRAGN